MIIRNSTKSILRMPVKTVFFTLLIVAVTAFLFLGVNTWAASEQMLSECDRNYTTIVTFEYLGDNYPNESVYDENMLREVSDIDFEAVAGNANTVLFQPSDCTVGFVDGFTAHSSMVPYQSYCVLVISDVSLYETDGRYYGKIENCLYSYRQELEGRHIFIQADGFDIAPEPDGLYIVHGYIENMSSGVPTLRLCSFSSYSALLAGVDCESIAPFVGTSSADEAKSGIYADIAEYYRVMNNKVYVYKTADIESLEEFHQGEVKLSSGRFFTQDEYASGAKVCILTETIASRAGLEIGDVFSLTTFDNTGLPAADCLWPGNSSELTEEYTLVGIVNYYDGLQYNVYTPASFTDAVPVKYIYRLGQATIKNGTADEFISDVAPLMPARVSVNVYDQGYQAVADSLSVIQSASAALSAVAFVASAAVLIFFAYLFVEKQRDTVETMRCFGTTCAETRLYLLFGAGLIALFATTAGVLIGTQYARSLITDAYSFISSLQALDTRYSSSYLGVTRDFTPIPVTSVPLAVAVGVVVFVTALALCLYFANRTITGRVMQARARMRTRRPEKHVSTAGRGAIRYSMISMRRSGARTLIVPALSLVMLLFVSTMLATAQSYIDARDALYDSTVLEGYSTTMGGKYAGNLLIKPAYAQQIADMEYIDSSEITYHMRYRYLGISSFADGTPGSAEEVPVPDNAYRLEALNNQLGISPYLVFTNAVDKAPEFFFSEFSAVFLDGYDASSFADTSWTEPFCMVSTQFMAQNGVSLGDTIRVYVANTTGTPAPSFIGIEMKVIGSFYRQASEDHIYAPLSSGAVDPAGLKDGEEASSARYTHFGHALRSMIGSNAQFFEDFDLSLLSAQQVFDLLLDTSYVASMSFTVSDARRLSSIKDALEEAGFSGPRQEKHIRCAILIDDASFLQSISSIAQRSKYMEILYPILLALVSCVGVIASYLMMNSRREEIAVMRGLGAPKLRIFASFFLEQLILLAAGLGIGAAVWALLYDPAPLAKADVYAFVICYAAGSAASLLIHNAKSALSILSEKE